MKKWVGLLLIILLTLLTLLPLILTTLELFESLSSYSTIPSYSKTLQIDCLCTDINYVSTANIDINDGSTIDCKLWAKVDSIEDTLSFASHTLLFSLSIIWALINYIFLLIKLLMRIGFYLSNFDPYKFNFILGIACFCVLYFDVLVIGLVMPVVSLEFDVCVDSVPDEKYVFVWSPLFWLFWICLGVSLVGALILPCTYRDQQPAGVFLQTPAMVYTFAMYIYAFCYAAALTNLFTLAVVLLIVAKIVEGCVFVYCESYRAEEVKLKT